MSQFPSFYVDLETAEQASQLADAGRMGRLMNVRLAEIAGLESELDFDSFEDFYLLVQTITRLSQTHRRKIREAMWLRARRAIALAHGNKRYDLFVVDCLLDIEVIDAEYNIGRHFDSTNSFASQSALPPVTEEGCLRLSNFINFGVRFFKFPTYVGYLDVGCALVGFAVVVPDRSALAAARGISVKEYTESILRDMLANEAWKRACNKFRVTEFTLAPQSAR
jgi:hypothetical protein